MIIGSFNLADCVCGVQIDEWAEKDNLCRYPANSMPACTTSTFYIPNGPKISCDFACVNGFTKSGGSCVCMTPSTVRNGVCGLFPDIGSARHDSKHGHNPTSVSSMKLKNRRVKGKDLCTARGEGWQACAMAMGASMGDWMCVDTLFDSENCTSTPLVVFSTLQQRF